MPEIKVVNMAGAEVGTMTLSDKVFGAEVNGDILDSVIARRVVEIVVVVVRSAPSVVDVDVLA